MKKLLLLLILVFASPACTRLNAQNISGDWQGTLNVGTGLRTILKIAKSNSGGWTATLYSIDQAPDGVPVTSITLQDSAVSFSVDMVQAKYQGKLSTDGNSITGTFTQGNALPLDFQRATKESAWSVDSSPHRVQFVSVDKDVKLEVLDWGGTGRPVVLLAGLGSTAHVFDHFALKLISSYHVYGITRRGFGASSAPNPEDGNYSADRLGDDVLAVINALKLDRPVLVGHSIAGEELSSIGSRYPEKVAGLIYLDAGYAYAYYDSSRGDAIVDLSELRRELNQFASLESPSEHKAQIKELLDVSLPQFEKDLHDLQKQFQAIPDTTPALPDTPDNRIALAIQSSVQKYTSIKCPVLAIFAVPHDLGPATGGDAAAHTAMVAADLDRTSAQAKAFESGIPSARVVRLPNANHFVFNSNEADVLREMNAFLAKLP
jgi:pimeloyl-ACP methyl ester carboxylesterase